MADKRKSDRRINTGGGAYIEGQVHTGGGDFVGRDQYKTQSESNATLEQLTKLVADMRAILPQLDEETHDIVEGDFKVVETQLVKPEPKKEQVLLRLKAIAETLGGVVAAGEAIQKLTPMVQQAIAWAQTVLK